MSDQFPKFSAERLTAAREKAGFHKLTLAREAGVGFSTLKRLERIGFDCTPTLDVAARLAHTLGCSLDDFIDWGDR